MDHAIGRHARDGIAECDVVDRAVAEVRTTATHDDRHQVDGGGVQQAEIQALPGNRSGRHCNGAVTRDGLCRCTASSTPLVTK